MTPTHDAASVSELQAARDRYQAERQKRLRKDGLRRSSRNSKAITPSTTGTRSLTAIFDGIQSWTIQR